MKRVYDPKVDEHPFSYYDLGHFTKYIKLFYLKTFINQLINDDSIVHFPNDLINLIIEKMYFDITSFHPIPIIYDKGKKEDINISTISCIDLMKRLQYHFGIKNVLSIKNNNNRFENYRVQFIFDKDNGNGYIERNNKFIIINYKPNNKIVYQGNGVIYKDIKNIVNLCLI